MFGRLLENLRHDHLAQRIYYLLFVIRRLTYLKIAFHEPKIHPTFQLIILLFLNTASMIYFGLTGPLESLFDRRLELFNEFIIGACGLFIFGQTDMVTDTETKFNSGWFIIAIIQLMVVVNMYIVLKNVILSIYFQTYIARTNLYNKLRLKYGIMRNRQLDRNRSESKYSFSSEMISISNQIEDSDSSC